MEMDHSPSPYLRFLSATGLTTHPGGFASTRTIAQRIGLKSHMKVLDVGCGMGYSSVFLAKHYEAEVMGIDPSPELVDKAKALHSSAGKAGSVSFQVGDASNLLFEDDQFDLVLCQSVLLFIHDKEKALREMCRVAKPGGYVGLVELCTIPGPLSDAVQDFFARPEFQAEVKSADEYRHFLTGQGLVLAHDEERSLSFREHLLEEVRYFSPLGAVLHTLEVVHKALVSPTFRQDFFQLLQLIRDWPKDLQSQVGYCILLGRKPDL